MPMMEVFDTPESMFSCPRRESSTTAPQSLAQLNGAFVVEQAKISPLQRLKIADDLKEYFAEVDATRSSELSSHQ